MADLPVIADVFRCALNWSTGSQSATNVIHIRAPEQTSSDVYGLLEAGVSQEMWGPVVGAANVSTIHITPLDGTGDTSEFYPTGDQWTGEVGGNWSPAVAVTVKLLTLIRGRSERGRVYLPFTADTAQVDGNVTGDIITSSNAAWASFVASFASPSFFVVASYKLAIATDVTQAVMQNGCSTQRRRQRRVSFPR